jgi:hypothetical protein
LDIGIGGSRKTLVVQFMRYENSVAVLTFLGGLYNCRPRSTYSKNFFGSACTVNTSSLDGVPSNKRKNKELTILLLVCGPASNE